jgi:hypothetical protein
MWSHTIVLSHKVKVLQISHFAKREMNKINKLFCIFEPMLLHIIHLKNRKDRIQLLEKQIVEQSIVNYKLWEGVLEENPKKRKLISKLSNGLKRKYRLYNDC